MTALVDYNAERETNIIRNIAKEIVLECIQYGLETTQELANYMVKLKLLNPKNGFTASEVMPRSLTQQLVMSVVEDLKQDTPAMNCIRLQVYWNSAILNLAELKKEYTAMMSEKAEPFFQDLLNLEREDLNKLPKLAASYILVFHNLGNVSNPLHVRETMAAVHSVLKTKDISIFLSYNDEMRIERIKRISKKVAGIRLYLKMTGKAGEGIDDVKTLSGLIESCKEEVAMLATKVEDRIDDVRSVISSVLIINSLIAERSQTAEINLPPEFDIDDLKYLKKILVIMLQHSVYLSEISSKLDEIDGNANFYLNEFDETLQKLQRTIRDREAVPTTEVYDDFVKTGEIWMEIQSYFYCLESVQEIVRKLEEINKREYFNQTPLEKSINLPQKSPEEVRQKSIDSGKTLMPSSVLLLKDSEDFHLEFSGFCAWTLSFADGFLIPGTPQVGILQYNDQYFAFSTKMGHDFWVKDPEYYLMNAYEILRMNPEMVELLNAYDNLYSIKSQHLIRKDDRKITTRSEEIQTVLHPIETYWDKDYTFSVWELKKRALALSRITKCVTKSAQTVNHSHYRSSIGVLAAPDKDKQVQTKRDSSCVHPAISTYLYGLRGHREDKFRVIDLTRPVEETCLKEIVLEKGDPCRNPPKWEPFAPFPRTEPCRPWYEGSDKRSFSSDRSSEFGYGDG